MIRTNSSRKKQADLNGNTKPVTNRPSNTLHGSKLRQTNFGSTMRSVTTSAVKMKAELATLMDKSIMIRQFKSGKTKTDGN